MQTIIRCRKDSCTPEVKQLGAGAMQSDISIQNVLSVKYLSCCYCRGDYKVTKNGTKELALMKYISYSLFFLHLDLQ